MRRINKCYKVQGLTVSVSIRNMREIHSLYRYYEDTLKSPPAYCEVDRVSLRRNNKKCAL